MFSLYRHIQAFSIDVALGGVVGAIFITKYLGLDLNGFVLTELGLAIWLIYTFDHLVDSGSGSYNFVSFRHKIHQRLSRAIWGIWSFTLIVGFTLLSKIPADTRVAGIILGIFVVAYFISLKLTEGRNIYHKEISCSVIYATGIFLGPASMYKGELGLDIWILYLEFILLAYANLLIFSIIEQPLDKKSGFQSIVITIGDQKARSTTVILLSIIILMAIASIVLFGHIPYNLHAQFVIILMASSFIWIFAGRRSLVQKEKYRVAGDAVFFIPLIYLFL